MKKNYYELLGVSKDASTEDIKYAFISIANSNYPDGFAETDPTKKQEYVELLHAYQVLSDDEERAKYDKTLKPVKNLKFNKPKLKKWQSEGIKFICMTTASVLISLLAVAAVNGAKGQDKNSNSDSSSLTTTEYSGEQPIEQPVIEEKLLTAENFEEKVQEILSDNQGKGLNIDPTFIKSALFITNIDYLSQDDIKDLYGNTDLNMIEEIQNMYNYTSAVGTHNNNVALGQEQGQYISLAKLAYDEQDKAILYELDQEFTDLVNDINQQTMTDEQFQASFKYITEFYTGKSPLVTDTAEYDNYSLTSGAGLLSEQYWPMFSVNYASSEFITNENMIDIKTLSEGTAEQPAVINGSKYLGAIINHEALACLEEENTLTKTQ